LVPSGETTFSVAAFNVRFRAPSSAPEVTPPSSIEESSGMFGLYACSYHCQPTVVAQLTFSCLLRSWLVLGLILGGIVCCCILIIVLVVCVVKRQRDDQNDEQNTLSPDYSFTEKKEDETYFGYDDDPGVNGEQSCFCCVSRVESSRFGTQFRRWNGRAGRYERNVSIDGTRKADDWHHLRLCYGRRRTVRHGLYVLLFCVRVCLCSS
jgi:hypothetical protein